MSSRELVSQRLLLRTIDVCRSANRQRDEKHRTASRVVLDHHAATVYFNRPFRDRQTQASAAAGTRTRLVQPEEPIENPIAIDWGNSGPLVGDFNNGVLTIRANANVNDRSRRTVFDGIVEE